MIPWLGNLFSYFRNAAGLTASIRHRFGPSGVVRLKFLNKKVHVVSGADYINDVWKSTKELTSTNGINIALSNMFNTPDKDMQFFRADNSGITHDPHPNSSTRPEDRVFYLMHKATVDCLAGSHLVSSASSFQVALEKQIRHAPIGNEWSEMPDLFTFLRPYISHSTVEAMCGSHFVADYPNFVEDFWRFNSSMPKHLQGWPRWLAPKAWQARDRCIETMKTWRKSYQNSHHFSGNMMIPQRWNYFSKMRGISEIGVACSDLGILWGMNSNSMPATFWLFIELLRSPHLLDCALTEVNNCRSNLSRDSLLFDIRKLCAQPFLQSAYAETLRLRTAVYMIRKPDHAPAQIKDYQIPQGEMIVINSAAAHMDERNWNRGPAGQYPVEQFWAERFLTYPDAGLSQVAVESSTTAACASHATSLPTAKHARAPVFSLNGYAGAWIPFGGGIHQCPGRHWVKLQILLSFAMMCRAFEIELSEGGGVPAMDMRKYGLGVLQPEGSTPFRIRRRV
ncbi:hypothetical protein MMC13_000444 [Lambiella insularis]|nr:hypothetical protein [Lambiella insularis]